MITVDSRDDRDLFCNILWMWSGGSECIVRWNSDVPGGMCDLGSHCYGYDLRYWSHLRCTFQSGRHINFCYFPAISLVSGRYSLSHPWIRSRLFWTLSFAFTNKCDLKGIKETLKEKHFHSFINQMWTFSNITIANQY